MKTEINLNSDFEFINSDGLMNINADNNKLKIYCNGQNKHVEVKFNFMLSDSALAELTYAFYGREFLLSNESFHIKCEYGYMYPFSAITFLLSDKGVTLISSTAELEFIELSKNESECFFTFGFSCIDSSEIEFIKNIHSGNYVDGINAYRNWYIEKFGSLPQSRDDIKKAFHVRRYFFNRRLCGLHILDNNDVCLNEIYTDDCACFGGIDVALLFDFAYDEATDIRCGNTEPIHFNKSLKKNLQQQIQHIKETHQCKFFCYFDPYLIQDNSELDSLYRDYLPILKKDGSFCYIWDKTQWPPCLYEDIWQQFSTEYLNKAASELCCDGIYLDEFGNGTQYKCHNDKHSHGSAFSQIKTEAVYHQKLKESMPDKLWMCEFPPPDLYKNNFDIVLSDTRTLINIYRFIFPELKFVRIIGCDRPLGDNEWDVNKSFFNGEGLWLDNNPRDESWYPESIKKVIRNQYSILKDYCEYFTSDKAEALYHITEDGVLVNKFEYNKKAVLTFINPTDNKVCTEIQFENLQLIKNLYEETPIKYSDSKNFLLEIEKKSVGCALFALL